MRTLAFAIALSLIVVGFWLLKQNVEAPTHTTDTPNSDTIGTLETVSDTTEFASKSDLIRVDSLDVNEVIFSPLTITGEARGYWFFEASFPIVLTNWDGLIIAEGYAQATDEWMTEDFVPFTASIAFDSPYRVGDPDFMRRGTLILQKDNPSGLPEHDDALEMPITFAPAL
jgi:hypothetical protein